MQSINTLTQIIQQDNKIMTIEIYDFIITNGLQNRLIENIGNNIYQPNYYNLNFPIISFTCLSHNPPKNHHLQITEHQSHVWKLYTFNHFETLSFTDDGETISTSLVCQPPS